MVVIAGLSGRCAGGLRQCHVNSGTAGSHTNSAPVLRRILQAMARSAPLSHSFNFLLKQWEFLQEHVSKPPRKSNAPTNVRGVSHTWITDAHLAEEGVASNTAARRPITTVYTFMVVHVSLIPRRCGCGAGLSSSGQMPRQDKCNQYSQ